MDVDTAAGLEGIESVLAVDFQVVAFPQDGLLQDPGAAELCEEAMRLGADVVGGIPWIESTDRDARVHIEWACRLAADGGHQVAMLVDDAGNPALRTGLGFVSDPHTVPLQLPVREFLDDGLAVALGQDDIEDAYYPFGRNIMLEVAFLAAHLLQFLSGPDQIRLIELVTDRAAIVLGIERHRIEVGAAADLCVHTAERVVDLLRDHAAPRWVVPGGRVIAENETRGVIHR